MKTMKWSQLRLGLIWIGLVECPNKVRGILHMFLRLPAGGLQCVIEARPLNKVQKAGSFSVTVNLAVQDSFDFVFIRVINLQWWRWVIDAVWNQTWLFKLEKGDMEDWMYALE